jgi:hypothetical protein
VPVVHVRALDGRLDAAATHTMLASLAEDVSRACDCPTEDVWCTFAPISHMTLGITPVDQNGSLAYVDVLMRPRDSTTTMRALEAAGRTTARHLRITVEDVWVRLAPVRSGEVFAGGRVLRW